MDKKKVVLAYSGGLDTSVLIKKLTNEGYEVIAFLADLGQKEDLKKLEKKAYECGASQVFIKDLKLDFVEDFIIPTLKAEAVYQSGYYLTTALGRPLIAKELIKVAKFENAEAVAHGCTGKGNDQVRFELTVNMLAPELEVIAPMRKWDFGPRKEKIEFAKKNDISVEVNKENPYSIDKNLWGVSTECGELENPENSPPEEAYQITQSPIESPDEPEYIEIEFEQGAPIGLNGQRYKNKLSLIKEINHLGCKFGVGRSDIIEDRLVGIKSREIYEAPGAVILYTAHRALEAIVLTKNILDFKQIVSQKYAELIYSGLWFSELKSALDKFIASTQKNVSGKVGLELYKGHCRVVKRKSEYSLYNKKLATYEEEDIFDHKASEGFIKIFGLPYRRKSGFRKEEK